MLLGFSTEEPPNLMTFITKWLEKDWVGSGIQEELKIYPCMGFNFCQNCPFKSFAEKENAIHLPICAGKMKPKLENGKIISEAIDPQFY